MEMGKFFRVLRFFLLSNALRNHDSRAKIYIYIYLKSPIPHFSPQVCSLKTLDSLRTLKKKKKKKKRVHKEDILCDISLYNIKIITADLVR